MTLVLETLEVDGIVSVRRVGHDESGAAYGGQVYVRDMFDLLNLDHNESDCGFCLYGVSTDAASWPKPRFVHDLGD